MTQKGLKFTPIDKHFILRMFGEVFDSTPVEAKKLYFHNFSYLFYHELNRVVNIISTAIYSCWALIHPSWKTADWIQRFWLQTIIICTESSFFGKSKRRTRTTYHLARAFQECSNTVLWLNPARIRRRSKKDSNRWILNRIKAFEPDLIFIYSMDMPLGVLQKIAGGPVKTMLYYEDMRREVSTSLAQMGRLVDFFLATNKGMLPDYKQAGIASSHLFYGCLRPPWITGCEYPYIARLEIWYCLYRPGARGMNPGLRSPANLLNDSRLKCTVKTGRPLESNRLWKP